MTRTHALSAALALAVTTLVPAVRAQDWPHWRGPHYNGSTEATGLPIDFSPTERVKWATDLPGVGACTPIVVGDRIFLTSVDEERSRLVAFCLRRSDGVVLWRKDAGSGYLPASGRGDRVSRGGRSNYASPSPTTDGERVVFFFGNGDLVAYDFAGQEQWRRNIQKEYGDFAFQWTFSASPTIWDGRLILPVLQRDVQPGGGFGGRRGGGRGAGGARPAAAGKPIESFVLAIDPATGENLYKHVRPSDAVAESLEAYTTAIPHVGPGGRKEYLIVGGDVLTGHDLATGAELWRWGTWNPGHRQRSWRLVPSVVVGDGVALVCAPKNAPAYAVRIGGEGELGEAALAWQSDRRSPVSSDVPTPAYLDGHFYVLGDGRAAISKVAAKDGGVVWSTELSRDYRWRASPTVADGKVFLMDHNGKVVVVDAADGKILHQVRMGHEEDDSTRSSIVVAHGDLYVRSNWKLFRIGK